MALILHALSSGYDKPAFEVPSEIDWNSVFLLAKKNNLLYNILLEVLRGPWKCLPLPEKMRDKANALLAIEERNIETLKLTISEVGRLLLNEDFIVLNTVKTYPYSTHDVDIVVKDVNHVAEILSKAGLAEGEKQVVPHQVHYAKPGLLEIDVVDKVAWGSIEVVDSTQVWEGAQKVRFLGNDLRLPSVEADALSILGHLNFQLYQLTLADLIYLWTIIPLANWQIMVQQAQKHHWLAGMLRTVWLIESFHQVIYETPLIQSTLFEMKPNSLEFPYVFSSGHVASSFLETGFLNLVKFPSYLSIRLKKHSESLSRAYTRVALERLSIPFIEYIYY